MNNWPGKLFHFSVLSLCIHLSSCHHPLPPPVIAVSKASDTYINWLKRADPAIRYINLYPLSVEESLIALDSCSGLLLTGGGDIYPGIYGEAADTIRCDGIDHFRDTLEINLILRAIELEMPIFGICRGEQILNVVFGGELFIDLPEDFDTSVIHRCSDYLTCFHWVYVEPRSLLRELCGCDSALVTSNHHQAVMVPGQDVKPNAYSGDGLIEGIELMPGIGHFFLVAVQWHPERMEESNPLSGPLAKAFIAYCKRYSTKQK